MRKSNQDITNWEPPKPTEQLPENKTCSDCKWFKRCKALIQQPDYSVSCGWYPSRFIQNEELV